MDIQYIFENSRIHHTKYKSKPNGLTIFVDYGDANYGASFDHHLCRGKESSTSLICSKEGIERLTTLIKNSNQKLLHVVTHSSPDLDSVATATVVTRFAKNNFQPLSSILVDYIRAKDQGEMLHEDIRQSISLLFQLIKNNRKNDMDIMVDGISLIEAIDSAIRSGLYHLGWNDLSIISGLSASFVSDLSDFERAIEVCRKIIAKSPKTLLALPQDKNGFQDFKWAESIFFDFSKQIHEPLGWKDLIRSDKRITMFGDPTPCMGVHSSKRKRDNYIFSVTPESGFSLKGFGAYLDSLEDIRISELQSKQDWPERIQEIANNRSLDGTPNLIRTATLPREGYSNSDPWYDGRGHNHTIIDTPESGSVLNPSEVLMAFLQRYSPFWKERVQSDCIKCIEYDIVKSSHSVISKWLYRALPQWDGISKLDSSASTKRDNVCLADVISSLNKFDSRNSKFSVYIPIVLSSPQTFPEHMCDLHINLAHYLIAYRNDVICAALPTIKTLQTWASKMISSPLPGKYWSVSDGLGLIMLDYMPDEKSEVQFESLTKQFFDLIKQLKWTDTLTSTIRLKKRYEAFLEFIERSKLSL